MPWWQVGNAPGQACRANSFFGAHGAPQFYIGPIGLVGGRGKFWGKVLGGFPLKRQTVESVVKFACLFK